MADAAPEVLRDQAGKWAQEYERITGERVIAMVIHRDEGYVDANGQVHRNVHAHPVVDRTDELGRVVNSIPDGKGGTRRTTITDRKSQGRRVQDMTARITGLARGVDARESKRRHIDHHSYRALARQGRLRDVDREETLRRERDASQSVAVDAIRDRETAKTAHAEALAVLREIGDKYGVRIGRGTQAEYAGLREAMKASGQASQQEYRQINAAFDALNVRQELERRRRKRRPGIEGRASDDDGQEHAAKARLTRERDEAARMTIWKDSQGREVLHVTRSRIDVLDHSRDVEHVALRIAAQKFGDAVSITGGAEFRERMARLATREGIEVADADLAQIVEDERQRMTQPKQPPRSDPTTARLAAWWNPKSRVARLAALDAAQQAGYTRTPDGAWHAMRDAVEHKVSADQAVHERLESEEDQSRIRNSETERQLEPDDEWDFGR